ncbi:helix-turn-helix domain-containing protein [Paenibacillus hemerocallicola]|jgi:AraC-like DNA-binding protein|uniref:Helix-turn-helix domain-containing protein n=1 Tax=Paenibacillus hemerocallicola TaxID=1172614 RepID=A0A5C4TBB7_9BACL|nr:AraC family transcriptional regulator [Paenibacillus hemerocallicola]TNJ65739.1 helix-turn-helix domain-containing protein [Paenibacillus hemerocallicola]
MNFVKTPLETAIEITHLFSLHYFEFAKDFIFEGEAHDFWELLYVDKGEIEVTADSAGYVLKQGDVIFHKPNEFHSVWANRKIGPNVIVVCFECRSAAMKLFENKLFCLNDQERNWMAGLVRHGFAAYEPPFDRPRVHDLIRRNDAPFGSEQLLRIHLELLLLSLATRGEAVPQSNRLSSAAMERSEDELLKRTVAYMEEQLCANLTLEELCARFHVGQSRLSALFKERLGMSVMKTYKNLKIERVKLMIREERRNFTEIAEQLGYNSIHTFSRHFKTAVGMTPTEYAKTVKARVL